MIILVCMMMFLFTWAVIIICFPWIKEKPKYNFIILLLFTVFEGVLLGEIFIHFVKQ